MKLELYYSICQYLVYFYYMVYYLCTHQKYKGRVMNINTAKGALYEPPKVNFFSLLLEGAVILAIAFMLVFIAG